MLLLLLLRCGAVVGDGRLASLRRREFAGQLCLRQSSCSVCLSRDVTRGAWWGGWRGHLVDIHPWLCETVGMSVERGNDCSFQSTTARTGFVVRCILLASSVAACRELRMEANKCQGVRLRLLRPTDRQERSICQANGPPASDDNTRWEAREEPHQPSRWWNRLPQTGLESFSGSGMSLPIRASTHLYSPSGPVTHRQRLIVCQGQQDQKAPVTLTVLTTLLSTPCISCPNRQCSPFKHLPLPRRLPSVATGNGQRCP